MPKILLAYPPSPPMLREDRCQIPVVNLVMSPPLPPMDLLYMAAVAEKHGANCRISDYTQGTDGQDRFIADLKDFRPDYLILSITTPTIEEDLDSAAVAKELFPGLKIIAKGAHFLRFDAEVFEQFPHLDMAIYGEAELTLAEILSDKNPEDIKGLIHRVESRVVRNPPRTFHEDLDSLPFPARHLIDNRMFKRLDTGRPQAVIKVSRGCPHNCFFCLATAVSGPFVRMRSPQSIVREIKECIDTYTIRDFLFWSDLFNADKSWVMSLCEELGKAGLDVHWSSNARVNNVDEEMARAMKQAGCELVSIGVESGSQDMLNRMGKGTTVAQIRNAFSIFRLTGIKTLAYYLVGLPWETEKTAEETIRFAIELDSDLASFFIATPLPGTKFYEYAVQEGLLEGGSNECTRVFGNAYHFPSVQSGALAPDTVASLQRRAIWRFFLRPAYIARTLSGIRSIGDLMRYGRAAASVIAGSRR